MKSSVNWSSISLKWRWRLLFTGIVFLFFIAFQFNVKKTASIIESYHELKEAYDTIPKDLKEQYTSSLKEKKIDSNTFRQSSNLLKDLAIYCDSFNVQINEIAQNYYSNKDSLVVETNKITLQGTYEDMLKFIFFIEKEKMIAIINSATWELTKDNITGEYELISTLYIKRIVYAKV